MPEPVRVSNWTLACAALGLERDMNKRRRHGAKRRRELRRKAAQQIGLREIHRNLMSHAEHARRLMKVA